MPLPIGHSAAGLGLYFVLTKKRTNLSVKERIFSIIILILTANFADLDFLPGFVIGEPGKFHHGPSHSLFIAIFVALVFYLLFHKYWKTYSKRRILICTVLLVLSHPILDYFSADSSKLYGVPLFWPLDSEYYISSISLFRDVQRSDESVGSFFKTIVNRNNTLEFFFEMQIAGILIFTVLGYRNLSKPSLSFIFFIASLFSICSAIVLRLI